PGAHELRGVRGAAGPGAVLERAGRGGVRLVRRVRERAGLAAVAGAAGAVRGRGHGDGRPGAGGGRPGAEGGPGVAGRGRRIPPGPADPIAADAGPGGAGVSSYLNDLDLERVP